MRIAQRLLAAFISLLLAASPRGAYAGADVSRSLASWSAKDVGRFVDLMGRHAEELSKAPLDDSGAVRPYLGQSFARESIADELAMDVTLETLRFPERRELYAVLVAGMAQSLGTEEAKNAVKSIVRLHDKLAQLTPHAQEALGRDVSALQAEHSSSKPSYSGPNPRDVFENIIRRADARGWREADLGRLLQASGDKRDVLRRLVEERLLETGEVPLETPADTHAFNMTLHMIWYGVSPKTPPQFDIVESPDLPPSVKVERDGIEYTIFGINHGFEGLNAHQVAAVVRRAREAGAGLYSEENIPQSYGFADGKEFLDHQVLVDKPIAIVPARFDPRMEPAKRDGPDPLHSVIQAAVKEQAERFPPAAKFMESQLNGGIDVTEARRVLLPYPLALSFSFEESMTPYHAGPPDFLRIFDRSRSMALAAAEDAARMGLRRVYILCGFLHTLQIAWVLSGGDWNALGASAPISRR